MSSATVGVVVAPAQVAVMARLTVKSAIVVVVVVHVAMMALATSSAAVGVVVLAVAVAAMALATSICALGVVVVAVQVAVNAIELFAGLMAKVMPSHCSDVMLTVWLAWVP